MKPIADLIEFGTNDFIENDWLLMVASLSHMGGFHGHDRNVVDFFNRWDREFP